MLNRLQLPLGINKYSPLKIITYPQDVVKFALDKIIYVTQCHAIFVTFNLLNNPQPRGHCRTNPL